MQHVNGDVLCKNYEWEEACDHQKMATYVT